MTVTAVMLFGYVSLDRLALNLLPEITYPSLTVQTDYEDAAPEEIESLVTRPVEEAVGHGRRAESNQFGFASRPVGGRSGVRLGHRHGHGRDRTCARNST